MIKDLNNKSIPKVGVSVIVMKEGKILLGMRKNAHGAGSWATPGGHLKHKESVEECALRELAEETGLKGVSLRLGPWTNDIIEEDKHYITLFVFIDFFEGEPQLKEPHKCEQWKWFDWNDLPLPLFPTIRSLIQTMGMEKLKQVTSSSISFLQNVTYPLASGKNTHPILVKLCSEKKDNNCLE
jgi:8-oxo-dGTP diphosphatase